MPKPKRSFPIPTKFNLETLEELRQASERNERSLAAEIRFRIAQSFKAKDIDTKQAE